MKILYMVIVLNQLNTTKIYTEYHLEY